MFPYWERLVCLLLARSLSHPSPRTPHSEVLNLGIIPLHHAIITNKKTTNKLADIGKNCYLCSKNRLQNLPIDRKGAKGFGIFAPLIKEWGHIDGYLTDTCLTAQDQYKNLLRYFKLKA